MPYIFEMASRQKVVCILPARFHCHSYSKGIHGYLVFRDKIISNDLWPAHSSNLNPCVSQEREHVTKACRASENISSICCNLGKFHL